MEQKDDQNNKIASWPAKIWLQWNPDELEEYPGASEALTWSDSKVHRTDVAYVRADLAAAPAVPAVGALTRYLAQMENILREDCKWNGNDYDYAEKSETDVAMLVDLVAGCLVSVRALAAPSTAPADPEQAKLDRAIQAAPEATSEQMALPLARYRNGEGFDCGVLYVEFAAGSDVGFGIFPDGSKGEIRYKRNEAKTYVANGDWHSVLIETSAARNLKCWSCKRPYTARQREEADGNCPHCGVEIELEDPAATTTSEQMGGAQVAKYSTYEIADACVKAGLGILECNSLIVTLKATTQRAAEGEATERKPLTDEELVIAREGIRSLETGFMPNAAAILRRAIEQYYGITGGGK